MQSREPLQVYHRRYYREVFSRLLPYLQAHRPGLYNSLLLSGTLYAHLLEINQTARKRLELMIPEMAKAAGATKELKASEPLKWIGLMNTCKAQVEEIILGELIFV